MIIRNLGIVDYLLCLEKMKNFTQTRHQQTPDELWLVQHPSVFTQGIKDSSEHLLYNPNHIPVVKTDRGGQITYHGLGQMIVYCLLDIRQKKIGIKALVTMLEEGVISLLADYHIIAQQKPDAPGVYVNGAKIAALGLKVSRGKTYHGISLNVAMDLTPFNQINPCGYQGLPSTQMQDLTNQKLDINKIAQQLADQIKLKFNLL